MLHERSLGNPGRLPGGNDVHERRLRAYGRRRRDLSPLSTRTSLQATPSIPLPVRSHPASWAFPRKDAAQYVYLQTLTTVPN